MKESDDMIVLVFWYRHAVARERILVRCTEMEVELYEIRSYYPRVITNHVRYSYIADDYYAKQQFSESLLCCVWLKNDSTMTILISFISLR